MDKHSVSGGEREANRLRLSHALTRVCIRRLLMAEKKEPKWGKNK